MNQLTAVPIYGAKQSRKIKYKEKELKKELFNRAVMLIVSTETGVVSCCEI